MTVELKIDIDGHLDEKEIVKRMFLLKKFLQFKGLGIDKKKTKHGCHLRISFNRKKEIDDRDIVFLQLYLGSDRNREMFNWLRVKSGAKHWNALFRTKVDSNNKMLSYEQ